MAYRENRQLKEAIDIFKKGLSVEPDNVRILNELGITYRENNQFPEAIELLQKGIKIQPNNTFILKNLLEIFLFFQANKEKALVYFNLLKEQKKLSIIKSSYKSFIDNLDSIIEKEIMDYKLLDKYTYYAIFLNSYHSVIPLLYKLKHAFPADANITKKLGKTLSNRVINRREEGIKYLKEAITLYKKDNKQEEVCKLILYYFYHLLNHEELETLNEEIEYYKSDIVDWPGFYRFLGVFKQNLGRPEEDIINEFEKAIDKSRTDEKNIKNIKKHRT